MNERLDAARMAMQLETWDREYSADLANKALAAADAVMFSDEAVLRAATISGHKPSVVRAVIAALKGAGDEPPRGSETDQWWTRAEAKHGKFDAETCKFADGTRFARYALDES